MLVGKLDKTTLNFQRLLRGYGVWDKVRKTAKQVYICLRHTHRERERERSHFLYWMLPTNIEYSLFLSILLHFLAQKNGKNVDQSSTNSGWIQILKEQGHKASVKSDAGQSFDNVGGEEAR